MSAAFETIVRPGSEEDLLDRARAIGLLSDLDVQLARRLAALYGESRPGMLWSLALACHQEAGGHVCADLERLAREGLVVEGAAGERRFDACPGDGGLAGWLDHLASSRLVTLGDAEEGGESRPLVLEEPGRLYLRRSFEEQRRLAVRVGERARAVDLEVDWSACEAAIERLAPELAGAEEMGDEGIDWTRVALRTALARPLSIVTGGPGTGKTTMVTRLVALLIEASLARGGTRPTIRLLAPTGKAAAAMAGSFARARASLDVSDAVREALPTAAETIHRALHRQTRNDVLGRPETLALEADLVVVDEASMVDLALMARLFDACRGVARVVLLGDPDQLVSVEAGAVLAELCAVSESAKSSAGENDFATPGVPERAAPGIGDSLVTLRQSHRFEAGGGIGRLAEAIRVGDGEAVLALLDDPDLPEIERCDVESIEAVRGRVVVSSLELQRAILEASEPAEKLARMGDYRVLCAHRRGPLGVEALGGVLDEALAFERRTTSRSGWWWGRMLLVTHNAPDQDLWNGDVGLVEQTEAGLRALFPDGTGGVRVLSPGRLPSFESAIAMSVHKSQGSEFNVVDLVLGEMVSRLMTRELLYTGVTRARERLRIHASPEVILAALDRHVQRDSGLVDRLRAEASP
jgi:exodeoxyribonuclease V alpha subunit